MTNLVESLFTTKQVCDAVGIKPYQLRYLFDVGKVGEVSRLASGDRIYTPEDVERIKGALRG